MRQRAALAACALTVGVAVGACGGDEEEISKAEFVRQASQICLEGGEEISNASREQLGRGQPTEAELEEFVPETLVPAVEDQLDQIRDLGAPPDDEEEVEAILTETEEALSEIEDDPALILETGKDNPFSRADQLLIEYGLEACAN
jgi:hypothetical protein